MALFFGGFFLAKVRISNSVSQNLPFDHVKANFSSKTFAINPLCCNLWKQKVNVTCFLIFVDVCTDDQNKKSCKQFTHLFCTVSSQYFDNVSSPTQVEYLVTELVISVGCLANRQSHVRKLCISTQILFNTQAQDCYQYEIC